MRRFLPSLLLLGGLVAGAARLLPLGGTSPAIALGTGEPVAADAPPDRPAGEQSPAPPGQLHPGLVAALDQARAQAAAAGFELTVTSGYRSPERQQQLLDEEVAARGSYEEAVRWVFPPDRSMHVRGLAIDVGNGPAADWLQTFGSAWGLCRTLDWEWWHFEWRERWQDSVRCPLPAVDPADAPPM